MPKITFIGAGSLGFSRRLMIDLLTYPALRGSHFSLMDIDERRLEYVGRIARRIIEEGKFDASYEITPDRAEALKDADYVVTMILAHGIEAIRKEIEIPLKYGVSQCIGDTLGPGGVFRAQRTIPMLLEIVRDMEKYCPDAWLLNYTNPMSMLIWAIYETTSIKAVGLCHSVQGTAEMLAKWCEVPIEKVSYWVAGINHQAWVLEFKRGSEDLYPLIRRKVTEPEIWRAETTRCEMCKHLDYFVTESSGHNSEYNPWFRKTDEARRKYTFGNGFHGETGYICKIYGDNRVDWEKNMEETASGKTPIEFKRSHEYGSGIINALETGQTFHFNGNVKNTGLITNLPDGCCVEVPCFADRHGFNPAFVGELPLQCAAINRANVAVQQMAVKAALTGDRRLLFHAIAYDPLTAAVLTLDEIEQMVDEMFDAEKQWMPQYR